VVHADHGRFEDGESLQGGGERAPRLRGARGRAPKNRAGTRLRAELERCAELTEAARGHLLECLTEMEESAARTRARMRSSTPC
jgi:hypothetical protein